MTGGQRSSENDWSKVPEVYIKALTAAKSDDKEAAVRLLKQTISVAPTFSPAYTNLGLQELRAGQLESATANFKKSIELTDHNPVSYHYLGVIARMQGEFDQALDMYRKAIDQEPRYPAVYLNAGILLDLYMYDLPAALEYYQRYQELSGARDGDVSKWIIDLKRRISKGDV
jgi:tetratricopeptide (TPR) repeat protein